MGCGPALPRKRRPAERSCRSHRSNASSKEAILNRTTIIRLSGIAMIIASVGVAADAFGLAATDLAIGTMFFALLAGSLGLAIFLLQFAGSLAAGLSLLGILLILVANPLYGSELGAWLFALGQLSVGIALLPAGPLARLAAIFWISAAVMSLPPLLPQTGGYNFVTFGLALLGLGYTLLTQAGRPELAST